MHLMMAWINYHNVTKTMHFKGWWMLTYVDICWHMLTISTHHKGIQRHGSIVDHHGSYDHNIIPGFVGVYRASTQHRQLLSCSIKAPLLLRAFPEEETSKEANENEPKKGCVWTVYSDQKYQQRLSADISCLEIGSNPHFRGFGICFLLQGRWSVVIMVSFSLSSK